MNEKRKIFISGPMTGYEDFNFPMFDTWEKILKSRGYDVVNPANIDRKHGLEKVLNDKNAFDAMINEELEELGKCDTIFLLSGWEKSKGTRRELKKALELGHDIMLQENFRKESDDA